MALLEELEKINGSVEIQGSVFYVPQEPWIFTASLRQNIIFGKPYNKEKFEKIIKVCCLDQVMIRNVDQHFYRKKEALKFLKFVLLDYKILKFWK